MLSINDRAMRRARHAQNPTTSLVECTVRVSPSLARLVRKSAAAETEGASALDALLAPTGARAGEVEELREQIRRMSDDLGGARAVAARLQQDADVSRSDLAQCVQERIELERRLAAANTLNEKQRNEILVAEANLAQLETTTARQEAAIGRSVSLDGLDEAATSAIRTLKDRVIHGDEVRIAALVASGYDPQQVEAATAKQDRDEMRAFDRLMARPGWRRRLVLWLLGTGPSHVPR